MQTNHEIFTIPFLDLQAAYRELQDELDAAYRRVMAAGWNILGEEVERFEADYAAYCGAAHCVGAASGLDALHLAMRVGGIGPGDEVIDPSHTFIATWLAVTQAGVTPVPAEPDERTYNLDPVRIEAAITPCIRAPIPVHLYGQHADLDPILAIVLCHVACGSSRTPYKPTGAATRASRALAPMAMLSPEASIPARTLAPSAIAALCHPTAVG